MTVSRRRMVQSLGASALLAGFGPAALAQAIETAKVVVGFPAGGTADVLCRRLAEKLAPGYAKAAMVENKTGAAAQIAITSMKGAAADGSVMLLTPMSMNKSWIFGSFGSPSCLVRCGATLPTTPLTAPARVWMTMRCALVMAASMPPRRRT